MGRGGKAKGKGDGWSEQCPRGLDRDRCRRWRRQQQATLLIIVSSFAHRSVMANDLFYCSAPSKVSGDLFIANKVTDNMIRQLRVYGDCIYMYVYIYICVCVCMCVFVCVGVCVYVCVYVCVG